MTTPPSTIIGFSGSRSLGDEFSPLVVRAVQSMQRADRAITTGCARGTDSIVRATAISCRVFKVSDYGHGVSAFARRSIAMVDYIVDGDTGSGLIAYPTSQCPLGLIPAAKSSKCFSGKGNGTWATMAYAAGLGLPVLVFPIGFSGLPDTWGSWVPAGSGIWAQGFRLMTNRLL